ncbi:unnamed protein product [Dibothriocephalus latus]|uniref:Uncharacterized protein n=1 Tax=Dibothriocephalus latus TaxID=60516 RepID=A0A3P7M1Y7_DIBLA|nr:unnamed protein product [Dibothriocephalus latus]
MQSGSSIEIYLSSPSKGKLTGDYHACAETDHAKREGMVARYGEKAFQWQPKSIFFRHMICAELNLIVTNTTCQLPSSKKTKWVQPPVYALTGRCDHRTGQIWDEELGPGLYLPLGSVYRSGLR